MRRTWATPHNVFLLTVSLLATMLGSTNAAEGKVVCYPAPAEASGAADFGLTVNGHKTFVYDSEVGAFAYFSFEGQCRVAVTTKRTFRKVVVRPLKHDISTQVDGHTICFDLEQPCSLSIEFDDDLRRPLFLFANPIETDIPDPNDPRVRFFEGGKIHNAGEICLASGETLYIAGGAIVRGTVRAVDSNNVRILGRGILDATFQEEKASLLRFFKCTNLNIEGVIAFNGWGWTLVPMASKDVRIHNVKIIGWRPNDDGIDIVGCKNLTVANCFVRTKDDCVAVKASPGYFTDKESGLFDVQGVRVVDSVFWNAEWGNAVEIGFELQTASIRDIVFRNCDIIHVERGGVFTIHNGDYATVEDILYEDIRVEDARDKFVDFRVGLSIYSADCPFEYHRKNPNRKPMGQWMPVDDKTMAKYAANRGHIRNITLRNIALVGDRCPSSYLIGYDKNHSVSGIVFDNVRHQHELIRNEVDGSIHVERAERVRFVAAGDGGSERHLGDDLGAG